MSILLLALAAQAAGQQVTTYHSQPAATHQAVSQPALPTDQAAPAGAEPATSATPAPAWTAPLAEDPPAAETAPDGTAATAPSTVPAAARTGPILWRNIASGMHVADLRAQYPQGPNVTYKNDRAVLSNVPVIEGCEAKVNIMHRGGVVEEIVMRGEGSLAGRCSLKLITALSGKYGESLEKDKVRGSLLLERARTTFGRGTASCFSLSATRAERSAAAGCSRQAGNFGIPRLLQRSICNQRLGGGEPKTEEASS